MLPWWRRASRRSGCVSSTSASPVSMRTARSVRAASPAGGSARWSTRPPPCSSCRRPSTRSAAPAPLPGSGSDQDGASHGRRTRGRDPARLHRDDLRRAGRRPAAAPSATATAARRAASNRRWLVLLLAVVLVGGAAYAAYSVLSPMVSGLFTQSEAEDFAGPGRGRGRGRRRARADRRGHRHHPARRGRGQVAQRLPRGGDERPEAGRRDPARHLRAAQGDARPRTRSTPSPTPRTATSTAPPCVRGCGPARPTRCCRSRPASRSRSTSRPRRTPRRSACPRRPTARSRAGCSPRATSSRRRPPPSSSSRRWWPRPSRRSTTPVSPRRTARRCSPWPRWSRPRRSSTSTGRRSPGCS